MSNYRRAGVIHPAPRWSRFETAIRKCFGVLRGERNADWSVLVVVHVAIVRIVIVAIVIALCHAALKT
jgi:hypothetical protein